MESVPFRHWVLARAEDDHPAIRFEEEVSITRPQYTKSYGGGFIVMSRAERGMAGGSVLDQNLRYTPAARA